MATLGQIMGSIPGAGDAQKYVGGPSAPRTGNQPLTLGNYLKEPKKWQKVLGIIGDGLQAAAGGRGTFMPYLQSQRQQALEAQQAFDLAESEYQGKLVIEQYKRANPEPEKPTPFMRNYEWLLKDDPVAAANYKSRQTNDVIFRPGPDGQSRRTWFSWLRMPCVLLQGSSFSWFSRPASDTRP